RWPILSGVTLLKSVTDVKPKQTPTKKPPAPASGLSATKSLALALALAGDGFLRRLLGFFGLLRLLGLGLARLGDDRRQLDLAVGHFHQHRVARAELGGQQRFGQRILDQSLDHASQRAGAVDLVVALLGQE